MCKQAYRDTAESIVMDALAEAKEKGWTFEMLAERIGGSPHSFRHYAYGEGHPSLAVFIGILVTAKPKKAVKRIAELAGLRAVEVNENSLSTSFGRVMKEVGEAIAEISQALEDGEITEDEAKACLKEVDEAIDELIKFKNQLMEVR